LDHHEAGRREQEQPEHRVPVARADGGVGRDAAGIVARESSDETGPHDREERGERGLARNAAADGSEGLAGPARDGHRAMDRSDLFFQPRGIMSSTTSSTVTVPSSLRRASTTGRASRSYFAMSAATSSFGVSARTRSTFGFIP